MEGKYLSILNDKNQNIVFDYVENLASTNSFCQEMEMLAEQMNKIQYFPIPLIYKHEIWHDGSAKILCYLKFNLKLNNKIDF